MKAGIVDGFVNDIWQVAHDSGELGSAVTTYDITGLEGDTDCEYMLICRNVSGAANHDLYMRFNNDSGSNYGGQRISGVNTTTAAARDTGATQIPLTHSNTASGSVDFVVCHIQAVSGEQRTVTFKSAESISGTTVTGVYAEGGTWTNTASEVTQINLFTDAISGMGTGSRYILLKKVHATDGMKTGTLTPNKVEGAWERIYETTLTGAATTVSISNLTGDTDCLYKCVVRSINGYSGSTVVTIRPNNDGTGTNYGCQFLRGTNTTVDAARSTGTNMVGFMTALNNMSLSECIMYSKSGYVRSFITDMAYDITGTTIGTQWIDGHSWNNTADEITSITIGADQTNGLGIGTNISLYKLNL